MSGMVFKVIFKLVSLIMRMLYKKAVATVLI